MQKRTESELQEIIDNKEETRSLAKRYDSQTMPKEVYELMSEQCLSDNQLSQYFKVSEQTIKVWKNKHPEFMQAYQKGKDEYRGEILEDTLFKTATGYTVEEVTTKETTIKGKLSNGVFCPVPAIETTIKQVYIQPNQKALHTLIYNRLPNRYKNTNTPAIQTNYQQNNISIDPSKLSYEELKAFSALLEKINDEKVIEGEIIS